MPVATPLAGGQTVIVYEDETASSGNVAFDELNGALAPIRLDVQVASGPVSAVGVTALSNGGFTVEWTSGGATMAEDFNAQGQAVDQPYAYSGSLGGSAACASNADGATTYLPAGGFVTATTGVTPGGVSYVAAQPYAANGQPTGSSYDIAAGIGETFAGPELAPLAGGGYVAAFTDNRQGTILNVAEVSSSGEVTFSEIADTTHGAGPNIDNYAIAGLADGDFVLAWTGGSAPAGDVAVAQYDASGKQVGATQTLSGDANASPATIDALPDGRYVVSFAGAEGETYQAFSASGAPIGPERVVASGQILAPAASPVPLSGSPGWTGAAVLSNGDLVVVGGPGASGAGSAQTYDSSGNALGSTSLQAFEGGAPTVAALAGGFYKVSYADTSDFEVYNSSNQLVFWHNLWSPAGQVFTPLQDGDYTVTTDGSKSVGLVDTSGDIDWVSIPSDAPSGVTPTVTALDGGGFALTYAGSSHFDLFGAAGQQTGSGDLGASMSSFATATAATNNGAFVEMWLSADGGQNGLPSSLDLQTFNTRGQATSGVVTLTQDLDPWHTQMDLQSNPDGSITAFWSQGGQVWSSEITNGTAGPAQATGVLGSLSDADMVALSNGETGFAFLAYGDAWAEIWNPATGAKTVAELGAATGDGSTLHALATTTGGFAVSWRDGAMIEASIMDANGQPSAPMAVSGDLLGVNASGQAVTVHDNGQGTPVMQTYALSSGAFVHA